MLSPSPPASPPNVARRTADMKWSGGLETPATTGAKPADQSPPKTTLNRRASNPWYHREKARQYFSTSSDVLPATAGYPSVPLDSNRRECRMQITLQDYLQELRQRSAGVNPKPKVKPDLPAPVLEQVRVIVAKLPPQPLSLDALRSQVVGRYGRPPQRGEVAVALKVLGFSPVRIWRKGFDGRHCWVAS